MFIIIYVQLNAITIIKQQKKKNNNNLNSFSRRILFSIIIDRN